MPTRAASGSPAGAGAAAATACDDRQAGAHRALGVVLVRPRPAEIGQHAVAHELGDVALEARDLARDRVLVGADELAHLLGVEPAGERGRADQVDEHHRELPALGLGSDGMVGGARRRSRVPRRAERGRGPARVGSAPP